jgi:two-component system, OmpR family, response regulator
MANILIIEDDKLFAHDVAQTLRARGHSVDLVHAGREGLTRAMGGAYDLVTLDRLLPDVDGITILTAMRSVGMETPVLLMSALTDIDQRIHGLRAGGDDYLAKPFSLDEMSARVEVLLRRRQRVASTETVLQASQLELDLVRHRVSRGGEQLELRPTEFRMLEFMMRNAGRVLTRTMIFEAVWGCRFDPGTNLIDVHVGRLRKKLNLPGQPPVIRTVRGAGYMLT